MRRRKRSLSKTDIIEDSYYLVNVTDLKEPVYYAKPFKRKSLAIQCRDRLFLNPVDYPILRGSEILEFGDDLTKAAPIRTFITEYEYPEYASRQDKKSMRTRLRRQKRREARDRKTIRNKPQKDG